MPLPVKLMKKPNFNLSTKPHAKGKVHDAHLFPESQSGLEGPFVIPSSPPNSTDFHDWVHYYVQLVGGSLELLNAKQFNLRKSSSSASLGSFATALNKFALALKGGSQTFTKGSTSPTKLEWPLSGQHIFKPELPTEIDPDPNDLRIESCTVTIDFQKDLTTEMVVNALVQVEIDYEAPETSEARPPDNMSSSSSYLATSSSG